MKNKVKLLATLGLFLSLVFIAGCKKEITDATISAGQPTITASYSLKTDGSSSNSILAHVSWTTENATKGTLDGSKISLPSGDTTLTMNKGDKKSLLFRVENANGKSFSTDLKIDVPLDPSPPTLVLKVTPDTLPIYGGQVKITWTTNAKDGVFYNGVPYFNGSIGISIEVTKTSSFELIAKNGSFETAQSVNVFVLTPKPKEAKMAYGKSWRVQYSQESYDYNGVSGGTWTNTDIDFSIPCLADDIVKFSLSPQKYTYDLNTKCSGGVYATPDPFDWFLNDKDELIGLYPVRTVLDSPPHTLVWTYYNPEHRWDAVTQQFVDIPRYSKEFLEEVED